MKNSGGIIIGIVVAATAGVILGMLFAPEKGEEIRKSIKDVAGDWTKKIGDLLTDGKEELKSAKNSFSDKSNDLKHKVEKV
ncbi:MAG TPA: YtxH domain-containing protein [Cyclobacteriaceae bacterium]|jgi:gas vesicle protein|nr:YtxH domain-containing protein [Cyclobacteriaceae bacterium]